MGACISSNCSPARTTGTVLTAGGLGLFVDAKDDAARTYYERFGFLPLPDNPLQLFLPLSTIQEALRATGRTPNG